MKENEEFVFFVIMRKCDFHYFIFGKRTKKIKYEKGKDPKLDCQKMRKSTEKIINGKARVGEIIEIEDRKEEKKTFNSNEKLN